MRIGIDFDNTIVCYDKLFFQLAFELLGPVGEISPHKCSVRDYFRRVGKEDVWTEMQGTAYGGRIIEAEPFPGLISFLEKAHAEGHQLFVVSHKTRHPFRGQQYDLHQAALGWLRHFRLLGTLLATERVFFEPTKEEKISRIDQLMCDIFIDDLPEIIQHSSFPRGTRGIIFDPNRECTGVLNPAFHSWYEAPTMILKERIL